jgi:hypothetical protein
MLRRRRVDGGDAVARNTNAAESARFAADPFAILLPG